MTTQNDTPDVPFDRCCVFATHFEDDKREQGDRQRVGILNDMSAALAAAVLLQSKLETVAGLAGAPGASYSVDNWMCQFCHCGDRLDPKIYFYK